MASPWEVRSAPFSSSVLGIPSLTLSACRVQFCLLANWFTVATSAFENLMEAKDSFLGSKMLTGINNSVAESILWAPGLLRSPVRKPLRVHGLEPSVLWHSVSYFYHSVSLKKKNVYWFGCTASSSPHVEFSVRCGMRALTCGREDLVSQAGIQPRAPASGVWSLSHWTTSGVPVFTTLKSLTEAEQLSSFFALGWA